MKMPIASLFLLIAIIFSGCTGYGAEGADIRSEALSRKVRKPGPVVIDSRTPKRLAVGEEVRVVLTVRLQQPVDEVTIEVDPSEETLTVAHPPLRLDPAQTRVLQEFPLGVRSEREGTYYIHIFVTIFRDSVPSVQTGIIPLHFGPEENTKLEVQRAPRTDSEGRPIVILPAD